MRPQTKAIRDSIKHIEGAWCRVYKDGTAWAGASRYSREGGIAAMHEVRAALEAAGYHCECNGEPGTAGEHIVDVRMEK